MRFVLAVLLASVCFGTTGTAQALGPDASAASIGAARILIGGGALALIAAARTVAGRRSEASGTSLAAAPGAASARAGRMPRPATHRVPSWVIVAVGAGGVLGYQPAFFAGTAANGVAVGTVVALGSAPVITGALDWVLHRRVPGWPWGIATAIATVGVAVLAVASSGGGAAVGAAGSADAASGPLGLIASIGAGACYAVYTLAAKALIDRGWRAESSMGALFGGAAAASAPVLILSDASWLATGPGLAMALWLGLVTTTAAYLLFGFGLTGLPAATVSTLTLAEPLTAGILAVLLLGEQLSGAAVVGLLVLAAGIVVLAASGARGGRARSDRGRRAGRTPEPVSEASASVAAWTSSSSPASGSTPTPGGASPRPSSRRGTVSTR